MSKHKALFDRVMAYAHQDIHIRLVEMNGSRVNPSIKSDDFQDFDIVFYVDNFKDYIKHLSFIDSFGKVLVKQTTDDQEDCVQKDNMTWYIYMVQYDNGTRLDLSIKDIKDIHLRNDSLSKIVINKDNLDLMSFSDESNYYVKRPSSRDFYLAVNEFFWVCPYLGKGIARNQNIYVYKHQIILRDQIEKLLDWSIGMDYNFQISTGKGKSRYKRLLKEEWYDLYKKTYTRLGKKDMIASLITMIDLFDQLCLYISNDFNFDYDQKLKNKMLEFLNRIFFKTKAS